MSGGIAFWDGRHSRWVQGRGASSGLKMLCWGQRCTAGDGIRKPGAQERRAGYLFIFPENHLLAPGL